MYLAFRLPSYRLAYFSVTIHSLIFFSSSNRVTSSLPYGSGLSVLCTLHLSSFPSVAFFRADKDTRASLASSSFCDFSSGQLMPCSRAGCLTYVPDLDFHAMWHVSPSQ